MTYKLYSGTKNASSWAMRAWLALREQAIDFEEHIVDLRKPQRFEELAKIGEISPSRSVPVLVTKSATIFDSSAIMEFASEQGKQPLLPVNSALRARVRSFVAWQHSGLSGICPRLSFESAFYPKRRELLDEETSDCNRLFSAFENELTAHGGPYLFGDLTLADLAFAPTVVRLDAHKPVFENSPQTKRWFEAVLSRDSVREWLEEARNLPHIWLDGYLPN
ncbi:MAG: glutathione S-transferase family protein [Lysobacterales bacterium]